MMEMRDIFNIVLFGVIFSEVIFNLFADSDNAGAAVLSVILGGVIMLFGALLSPATLLEVEYVLPRFSWDSWVFEQWTYFFSHEDNLFRFSVGWLTGASARLVFALFFPDPDLWFLVLVGRYTSIFAALFVLGFLFGPVPFARLAGLDLTIDRRLVWEGMSGWAQDVGDFAGDLAHDMTTMLLVAGNEAPRPTSIPTETTRRSSPPTEAHRPTETTKVVRRGKVSSGPGHVGLRVDGRAVIYLGVPPVVRSIVDGRKLVELPLTVEFLNDTYDAHEHPGKLLPAWPRIVLTAPDGTILKDEKVQTGETIDAAESLFEYVNVQAEQLGAKGTYSLKLILADFEAETTFEVR
jgi:hypothetical protein